MNNFSERDDAKAADLEQRLLSDARAADKFEGYRDAHAMRIAAIADTLARGFNFAAHDRFILRQAALAHDLGEVSMNREYIAANRPLRPAETLDAQRHSVIGEQEAAQRGLHRAAQILVRWHHEWWNGAGYPDALAGAKIPLAARILRLADSYAALTAARPHRAALTAAEARQHLVEWAGIEFDPQVVREFLAAEIDAAVHSEASEKSETAETADISDSSNVPENMLPDENYSPATTEDLTLNLS